VIRGMKATFWRKVAPRLPFARRHIRQFMSIARDSGLLKLWRVVLAVSFQELLRFSKVAAGGHKC
jgi:hypothetical protein